MCAKCLQQGLACGCGPSHLSCCDESSNSQAQKDDWYNFAEAENYNISTKHFDHFSLNILNKRRLDTLKDDLFGHCCNLGILVFLFILRKRLSTRKIHSLSLGRLSGRSLCLQHYREVRTPTYLFMEYRF